jgi:hypothetical protein
MLASNIQLLTHSMEMKNPFIFCIEESAFCDRYSAADTALDNTISAMFATNVRVISSVLEELFMGESFLPPFKLRRRSATLACIRLQLDRRGTSLPPGRI